MTDGASTDVCARNVPRSFCTISPEHIAVTHWLIHYRGLQYIIHVTCPLRSSFLHDETTRSTLDVRDSAISLSVCPTQRISRKILTLNYVSVDWATWPAREFSCVPRLLQPGLTYARGFPFAAPITLASLLTSFAFAFACIWIQVTLFYTKKMKDYNEVFLEYTSIMWCKTQYFNSKILRTLYNL